MAIFETFGADDDSNLLDSVEIDCPICGKPFDISTDSFTTTVLCPHCDSEIEIVSK